MESIKQWAYMVCVLCIAVSIIHGAIPQKGVFSIIKPLLAIYIIITIISPKNTDKLKLTAEAFSSIENITIDENKQNSIVENTTKTLFENQCEKMVYDEFFINIIANASINISSDNVITIDSVTAKTDTKQEEIREFLSTQFANEINVTVIGNEGEDR